MTRLISFRGAFEAVCVVPSPSLSLPSSPMLTAQHLLLCSHLASLHDPRYMDVRARGSATRPLHSAHVLGGA
jgi:hypothetical protein